MRRKAMKLSEKQYKFTFMVHQLIAYAYEQGYTLTCGELYRTEEQQAIYLKTGRSKTMNSKHLQRLAVDFNLFQDGVLLQTKEDFKLLGEYWKSLDPLNRWGGEDFGDFIDAPHFEYNG